MLENGGKTPWLAPEKLGDMGFLKIVELEHWQAIEKKFGTSKS